ncbi:MAG TPA: hypothetical protein VG756_32500 [Pseudonocardiaceae bacterium]|nr:hypothetical protein [Pseudonocardiaceae bacterium]
MFIWLANWWDGVELWLTELPFPVQFLLVIVVLGPICLGAAWAIDRGVDVVSNRFAHKPAGPPPAAEPEKPVDTLAR